MTELPEPMTPADCDLRGMPYMPLDIVRLFDSDFYALSNGEEFKAGLSLWGKAFLQVPAGSLPDNDQLLAHLSGARSTWGKVKAMALHGWIKCSDGRLYHRTVAQKAQEAWDIRQGYRDRLAAARDALAKKRSANSLNGSHSPPTTTAPEPATETTATTATEPIAASSVETVAVSTTATITVPLTEHTTGLKGREGKGSKERKKDSPRYARAAPPDPRTQLWDQGVPILQRLTGKPERSARTLLGRLCRDAKDDCPAVLIVLRDAENARPTDPVSWIIAAIAGLEKPRNGFLAIIDDEGIGNPFFEENPRVH